MRDKSTSKVIEELIDLRDIIKEKISDVVWIQDNGQAGTQTDQLSGAWNHISRAIRCLTEIKQAE